jgi:HD-like signal output (HDOD) protein
MLLLEEEAELQDARVDALIDRAERLGMFPEMAAKVRDVANDNGASAQDLERVISKDAPLTAKVLRVANSPYYGGRRVVTTLRHALVVIGFREATQLALAFAMTAREGASESARRLQVHGAKTAVVARELARHTRTIEPAEAFVAGMLHDFGALALMEIYGLPYEQIYSAGGKDMLRSERELTGVDHAELGEACLMRWRFARSTSLSIRNHHRPLVYPGFDGRPTFTGDALVNVADWITERTQPGFDVSELADQLLVHPMNAHLDLTADHIEEALDSITREMSSAW